jgi:hypothetical protein
VFVQWPSPQKLGANVERTPSPSDRLTPHDLHIVSEFTSTDRDPHGCYHSDFKSPVRFNEASRHAAVQKAHTAFAREQTQLPWLAEML